MINLRLTQDQAANVVAKELMKYQAVLNLNMSGLCGSDFIILWTFQVAPEAFCLFQSAIH